MSDGLRDQLRALLSEAFEAGHWRWPTPDEPTRAQMRESTVEMLMQKSAALVGEDGRPDQPVEIIVNGQPVSVPAGTIRSVIAAAIAKSGQIGAPIDQWVLRTREGDIIPHELPGGNEYALLGGQRYFLHLGLPKSEQGEDGRLAKAFIQDPDRLEMGPEWNVPLPAPPERTER